MEQGCLCHITHSAIPTIDNDIDVPKLLVHINAQERTHGLLEGLTWPKVTDLVRKLRTSMPLTEYLRLRIRLWKLKRRFDSPSECPHFLMGLVFYTMASAERMWSGVQQ